MNIKFRAYNKTEGVWLNHREVIELIYDWNGSFDIDDYVIQQYTDLYDKNNVRICEGDVVKYTQHKGYLLPTFEFEVIKNDKKACFGYYENENLFVPFAEHDELEEDFLKHCEIVGNKFESSKNQNVK